MTTDTNHPTGQTGVSALANRDARPACRPPAGALAARWPVLAGLPLLVILPLTGVWLAGHPLAQYLEFPPLTRYVEHAGFSWPVFVAMAAGIAAVVLFLRRPPSLPQSSIFNLESPSRFPFPAWGWLGIVFGILAWVLAWTRFAWFAPWQIFTFSPLWFAYILVVNALTVRRTGRCLMTDRPLRFVLLFPASAVFWWFFEFLNRFVQNWYYVGIGDLSPQQYVLFATLPFSTVLPAVLSTEDLLRACTRPGRDVVTVPAAQPPVGLSGRSRRRIACGVFLLASAGLAGIGLWPDLLFPLLWVSPLLVMTSLQAFAGQPTIFAPVAHGDWRRIRRLALAALICGFFWEMWNYYSQARWIYTVPFVNRFHLFEMPLLGYAGYLPFGLECAVAAELILGPAFPRGKAISNAESQPVDTTGCTLMLEDSEH